MTNPNERLKHHVSGAIARGEAEAVVEQAPRATIKTVIRAYRFDVKVPAEEAAYEALRAKLKDGPHLMESWGSGSHYDFVADIDGQEVELETEHLFGNQWNTAPIAGKTDKSLRVFDWAQDAAVLIPGHIKQGHYLEQTDEMREVRRNTDKCGYCGRQEPAAKGYVFCPHCVGSAYLTVKDLPLTRMAPVCDSGFGPERKECAPLTEAEKAYLLPLYREAQLHGNTERDKARIAKQRKDIAAKYEKAVRVATEERDGYTWLMDHGIKTDNVIYYSHTETFSFGWRTPIEPELETELLGELEGFPFAYEIKSAKRGAA